jgi:tripartite-type tricarboxylate transporter receptor subunit TctC
MAIPVSRRAVALSAFCAAWAPRVFAADPYPARTVRLVVGWPAGGYTDALARALAVRLGQKWKQQVIVDNRPGASEIIGASFVASAPPDGYTLFMATDQALMANEFLYSKLPYKAARAFAPVTRVAMAPSALLVRADSPYETLAQLVDAAKRNPDKLTYGSNGSGSQGHIIGNWFAQTAGIRLTHVPYKGGAPALQALMGGEIDMLPLPLAGLDLKASKLRALALTSDKRSPSAPDVPTFSECGYDVDVRTLFSLVAPAATSPAIVSAVARDVKEILSDPSFSQPQIERFGNASVGDTPREFAQFLESEAPKVRARILAANVKLD